MIQFFYISKQLINIILQLRHDPILFHISEIKLLQENKYLNKIKELEYKNTLQTDMINHLEEKIDLLKENINDPRNKSKK